MGLYRASLLLGNEVGVGVKGRGQLPIPAAGAIFLKAGRAVEPEGRNNIVS